MSKESLRVIHHGGKNGVTGSCHELRVNKDNGVLIDCGLFQGDDRPERGGSGKEIEFPVSHIRALVITHVHIDHVGRIPYLIAAGFKGPIFCSEPSATLLPLVLEDAVKIGISRDPRLVERFLKRLNRLLVPVPYGNWQPVQLQGSCQLHIRLQPAGHILGSSYVQCRVLHSTNAKKRIDVLFSGDLGAPYAPLLPAPKSPYGADIVVLESTYGDRLHEGRRNRRLQLQKVVEKALADRGVILVPAFSIGRTQELLYEIEDIIHRNQGKYAAAGLVWEDIEIIVDSPLAARFTAAYKKLRPFWDREAKKRIRSGRHPLSFEQLTTINSHDDHLHAVSYLQKKANPCIVIAAGGMCAGGRVVNYLKALLGDKRTDILFVGYQAGGTPGHAISKYGPRNGYVVLDGERYSIKAGVHTISGYSAHADRNNLVNFVKRMRKKPEKVILVHGDPGGREALAEKIRLLSVAVEC
jgi:metallo-beta-lactamase family protein